MDTLTILMIAHDELAGVRVAVDSIREFGYIDNYEAFQYVIRAACTAEDS